MPLFNFAKKPEVKPSITAIGIPESSFSIRQSLDPNLIITARNAHSLGNYSPLLRCYEIFRSEDDSCATTCDIRSEALKTAVVSVNFESLTQDQAEYFNAITGRFAPLLSEMLLELKFTGSLFRQIQYELVGGLYYPADYVEYKGADLRLHEGALTPFDHGKPVAVNELQFIRLIGKNAVFYSILRYNVFFSFAINNWAQFCETFGKPPRIAKYKPGTSATEKQELWTMLQNFGTDLAAMVSENVVIDFADFVNKTANADLYRVLCDFCDDRITRRILGNTLTTKAVATGGSYAQASVHELVREDILAGDCRDLANFLTAHYNTLNRINFGGAEIKVTVTPKPKLNLLERIQIDSKLYNEIGIDFPADYWYRTYQVPPPEKR